MVCASGARSESAAATLVSRGIPASSLTGGTQAWTAEGHALEYPDGSRKRAVWAMERQVRFTAGVGVLLGLALGLLLHPALALLSAAIGGGLVFSALTNTCGMAVVLGRLPFNRRGPGATRERSPLRPADPTPAPRPGRDRDRDRRSNPAGTRDVLTYRTLRPRDGARTAERTT